ncbi:MAG: chemotaxis protein CheW [Halomonadaceae bacterium]|nr:MAG: chemotaxis protein CheW [Halomonadaceae bacterium]
MMFPLSPSPPPGPPVEDVCLWPWSLLMTKDAPGNTQAVISAYLDDLLSVPRDQDPYLDEPRAAPARAYTSPPAPVSPVKVSPSVTLLERPVAKVNLVAPVLAPVVLEAPEIAEVKQLTPEPEAAPAMTLNQAPDSLTDPLESEQEWLQGRPPWAQKGFECLIFRVAGLQLAVPLVLLGAIHRLDAELTPLFGRPDWFMGLLRAGDKTINVADTARWVMPERYRRDDSGDYQFVIRLEGSHWGLACHEVAQSFTVQPEDVKWRTANSRRQWLAGTVREHMCALLDVSRLAAMLAEAEKGSQLDMSR